MRSKQVNTLLLLASAFLFMVGTSGCEEQAEVVRGRAEEIKDEVEEKVEQAGIKIQLELLSNVSCEDIKGMSIKGGEGSGVTGVAGASRWGMPEGSAGNVRVRRSWSTLSDAEKKQVVDAFIKLKQTTVGSGAPGAERADYETFCDGTYTRNLYDYYVELHLAAFTMMKTDDMSHTQMAHMGPQFLSWHRYYLLRLEADMQQVLGDPTFTLPYWDWADCPTDVADGENPCPKLFESDFLGAPGSCDDEASSVTGYLVDQGFETHIWYQADLQTAFNTGSIRCSTKPLQRQAGCNGINDGNPPTAQDAEGIYDRKVFDAEPYDSCNTDEDVSFRQYLEGYEKEATNALCIISGCQTHGLGHLFVGGDLAGGGAPNDPIFFLHHANIDRLWAMWQDNNRADADTAVDYGNPEYPDDWRGAMFNFPEIRADEMFDFRALGFQYDTNPPQ